MEYIDAGSSKDREPLTLANADPMQMAAIRNEWHRRLDVQLYSIRYPWLVAGWSVPPLLWLAIRLRRSGIRRRRKRLGLCLNCGYDLRGSPGRCSECGEVVARLETVAL
jgi:hypothetical protein